VRNLINPWPEGIHEVYTDSDSSLFLLDLPLPHPGFDHHLSSWLLRDFSTGRNILVDTGPWRTVPVLERSIRTAGVEKLDLVLLTHIHADHAGGAGRLLSYFPEARILAPERGRPHLIRPGKLAEGTRTTLGAEMADAFGPILPVPQENLIDSASPLLEGITILDTPGHASHHSSYVFPARSGKVLFPGEAAGVGLGEAVRPLWTKDQNGIISAPYLFPATPPRLDGASMERSIEILSSERDAKYLCFSHYGWTEDAAGTLRMAAVQFREWTERARLCGLEEEDEAVELLFFQVCREDPHLALLSSLREEQRIKEEFFIRNSLRGIVRWVRS
jgi:glyoxylase-like metal-dependent hydrolase (beta-lactamase superfamily II)